MQDLASPASLKMKSLYYLYRLDIYIFMGVPNSPKSFYFYINQYINTNKPPK